MSVLPFGRCFDFRVAIGLQAILSRNSSTALPTRFTRPASATDRSGWATYQPSAWTCVLDDPVLHLRAVNPRPAFASRENDVHFVGNLRREVVDIGVPLAIVGGGEEQLRVVVQEDEAHVVKGANLLPSAEVAVQQPQHRRAAA